MEREITAAIAQLAVLQFFYKGKTRTAEPHALGYDGKGHLTLCAWQLTGGSGSDFRDFHIGEMSGLMTTGQRFAAPRPGYKRGDKSLPRVIAQL